MWPAPRSTTIAVSEATARAILTRWNFFMVRLLKMDAEKRASDL